MRTGLKVAKADLDGACAPWVKVKYWLSDLTKKIDMKCKASNDRIRTCSWKVWVSAWKWE
jgi:hypothetical protein